MPLQGGVQHSFIWNEGNKKPEGIAELFAKTWIGYLPYIS